MSLNFSTHKSSLITLSPSFSTQNYFTGNSLAFGFLNKTAKSKSTTTAITIGIIQMLIHDRVTTSPAVWVKNPTISPENHVPINIPSPYVANVIMPCAEAFRCAGACLSTKICPVTKKKS